MSGEGRPPRRDALAIVSRIEIRSHVVSSYLVFSPCTATACEHCLLGLCHAMAMAVVVVVTMRVGIARIGHGVDGLHLCARHFCLGYISNEVKVWPDLQCYPAFLAGYKKEIGRGEVVEGSDRYVRVVIK